MRAVIWITEVSWERCVDAAQATLPAAAAVTLLHVAVRSVEAVVAGGPAGLLGRRPRHPPGPSVRAVSEAEAEGLLAAAQARFGRPANHVVRAGRPEREVLAACATADLLVLGRDGAGSGPKSIAPPTRFVLDHVVCDVLVVSLDPAAPAPPLPSPPHEQHDRASG